MPRRLVLVIPEVDDQLLAPLVEGCLHRKTSGDEHFAQHFVVPHRLGGEPRDPLDPGDLDQMP